MEVLKNLLFLTCIASTWPMLAMETKKNLTAEEIKKIANMPDDYQISAEEIEKYNQYSELIAKTMNPNLKTEKVRISSLALPQFIKTIDFGSQDKTNNLRIIYSKSIIESFPDYENYLFTTKFVDFITKHPRKDNSGKTIKMLYINFNFNKIDGFLYDQIEEKHSKELDDLYEENEQQKLEIEKLIEQNKLVQDLTKKIGEVTQGHREFVNKSKLQEEQLEEECANLELQNKEQKLKIQELIQKIEELTQQNKLLDLIKTEKENSNTFVNGIEELTEQNKNLATVNEFQRKYTGEMEESLDTLKQENKKQKQEIEKLSKKTSKLLEEAKNKIEKLEWQNKQQEKKINKFTEQNQKSIGFCNLLGALWSAASQSEQQQQKQNRELAQANQELAQKNKRQEEELKKSTSFWQPRNLLFGVGALVLGGILGAWAHASFK